MSTFCTSVFTPVMVTVAKRTQRCFVFVLSSYIVLRWTFNKCWVCIIVDLFFATSHGLYFCSWSSRQVAHDSARRLSLKQLSSRCSKIKKITVNTGQVMFSGEIYYYLQQIIYIFEEIF